MSLTLDLAEECIRRVKEKAAEMKVTMFIAVVDEMGKLVAFARMGGPTGGFGEKIAIAKAKTKAAADAKAIRIRTSIDSDIGSVNGDPARLQQIDSADASQYAQRHADFAQRWQQAITRWTTQAAPLKGVAVVSQHKAFVYLYDWLGLKEVAVLEPKPGVEPTVSHLQQVLSALKATPPRMVLSAAYQGPRPSEWLSKNAGVTMVKLPFTVGGTEGAKDLFALFDDTIARMLAAVEKR